MGKYDGCEVSYAVLLDQIHTPSTGALGPKLSSVQDATNKAVKMTIDGEFVIVEVKPSKDKVTTLLVPITFFRQLTPVLK